MDKDLKTILKEKMTERHVSTPKLAKALRIPQDRIYAWYRDGTNPKGDDSKLIEKWIVDENYKLEDGDNSNNILEEHPVGYKRKGFSGPTWQDLLEKEEQLRKVAEARAEEQKAYNLFLQEMLKTSLAPILATVLEVREDQKGIVRFEQGLAQYFQGSAEISGKGAKKTGSGIPGKKDGRKTGTGAP
jgi:hypothetical protein